MKTEEVSKLYSNHVSSDGKMERNLEAKNNFETPELILDHNNREHTRSQDNAGGDTISNMNKRTWLECESDREENENKKFKTTQICTDETEITTETGKNTLVEEANEQVQLENVIQKLEPNITLLHVSKTAIPESEEIFENVSSKEIESAQFPISINNKFIEIVEEETLDNENNNIHNFETKDIFNTLNKEHDKDSTEANRENHDRFDNNNQEAEKDNESSKKEKDIIEKEVDDNRMKQEEEIEEIAKEEKGEESKEHGDSDDVKEQEENDKEEDEDKTKEETIEDKVDETANQEEMKKEETIRDVDIIHEDEKVTILTNITETKHRAEDISPKDVERNAEKLEEENQTSSTTEDTKDETSGPSVSTTDYVQKSEMNHSLIQTVLKHRMASFFQNMSSHKPYALNLVEEGSREYQQVKQAFTPTARSLIITKLERVENPYLLGMYLLKKEKMERQGGVEEKTLFHGTHMANVDGICRYNFDFRRCGQQRGHKFGQGVSFTPQVSYARHYPTYGDKVMILAKVLVSKVVVGNYNTVIPTDPYDTTSNDAKSVLVKYEDDDFFPQYVIHYGENLLLEEDFDDYLLF